MYLDYESLITENKINVNRAKIEGAKDISNVKHKFKGRVTGFVIEDTYNNLIFPIPDIQVDDSRINVDKIFKRFKTNYEGSGELMLPWHYLIEFYNDDYIIYNTRPLGLGYPYSLKELNNMTKNKKLNQDTIVYLNNKSLNLSNMIYICILGDTNKDVYNSAIYKKIVNFILSPISKMYIIKLNEVYFSNLGNNFKINILKNNFKS